MASSVLIKFKIYKHKSQGYRQSTVTNNHGFKIQILGYTGRKSGKLFGTRVWCRNYATEPVPQNQAEVDKAKTKAEEEAKKKANQASEKKKPEDDDPESGVHLEGCLALLATVIVILVIDAILTAGEDFPYNSL